MTDVRSLLRNERLARRIEHPHASYSSTGTLSCTVCRVQLKADSLWDPHVRGKPHRVNLQRLQEAKKNDASGDAPGPGAGAGAGTKRSAETAALRTVSVSNGKKRKADDDDEEEQGRDEEGGQKRARRENGDAAVAAMREEENDGEKRMGMEDGKREQVPSTVAGLPEGFFDKPPPPAAATITSELPTNLKSSPPTPSSNAFAAPSAAPAPTIDEAEWAAFEADLQNQPAFPSPPPPLGASSKNVLTAEATISAAPVSTEELAARSREEASVQGKSKREEEIEGEKEDAARQMEEEFDEMEKLEERLRRLKERKERVLRGKDEDEEEGGDAVEADVVEGAKGEQEGENRAAVVDDEDDEDDDDNYDDDDFAWGLR